MSLVGAARCVKFNVFSAKSEFAGVVVDELAGTLVINLGLFVGKGPFDLLCNGLGKKGLADLSLVIQLGSKTE